MHKPDATYTVHTLLDSIGYRPEGFSITGSSVVSSSLASRFLLHQPARLLLRYNHPRPLPLSCQRPTSPSKSSPLHYLLRRDHRLLFGCNHLRLLPSRWRGPIPLPVSLPSTTPSTPRCVYRRALCCRCRRRCGWCPGIHSASTCSRFILVANTSQIRHGVLEGHKLFPPQCFRLPYE